MGNLTITGHNSELGTKSFSEKKRIIKENSKANILNKEVLSAERWNEETIIKRAKVLSKKLINEFDYVEIHSEVSEQSELFFGVNSVMDFSDTKPRGFLFVGEYTKVSSWVDLLTKFVGTAYDLNSDLISDLAVKNYSIPNATRVYITNDDRQLRKAKQVENSGIFYETNLSANNIISFVKDLLLKMNLEVEDFSFLLSEIPFDINDEATWGGGIDTSC